MGTPLEYGAVFIYYSGGWRGWRNSYIHLPMSVAMCILTIICTLLTILKMRRMTLADSVSSQTRKGSSRAERSLTIALIAHMAPFINNTLLTYIYLNLPDYVFYFTIIRPFGNDVETCILPWILYLTHPMFKAKDTTPRPPSTVSIVLPKHTDV